jgi:hypothetical protein
VCILLDCLAVHMRDATTSAKMVSLFPQVADWRTNNCECLAGLVLYVGHALVQWGKERAQERLVCMLQAPEIEPFLMMLPPWFRRELRDCSKEQVRRRALHLQRAASLGCATASPLLSTIDMINAASHAFT